MVMLLWCVLLPTKAGSEIRGTRGARVRVLEADGMGCSWRILTAADGEVGRPETNSRGVEKAGDEKQNSSE